MGTTEFFAKWVVATRYRDIPADGYASVRQSMLDWIGCALVGSSRPAAQILCDHMQEQGGTPQARLVASGFRTSSADAAFANGVLGHLEDFDDSGAHPASFLTPTVLALGEEMKASGTQVLLAWGIGYEVSARIRAGLSPDRGWHTTPLYGTMGATAAAGKLLGLDEDGMRVAFGIGASHCAGLMANFGTMTKALHPGNAARSAITAAKLARRGYTADTNVFESRYGYADCFGGEKCNLQAMTEFLGKVSYLSLKPPAIKVWPCCSSNHPTLTGIKRLLAQNPIHADDIERVEHYSPNVPGTGSLIYSDVRNGIQGKFCLEYNIAAAFIDRQVDLATFSNERFKRGDLQAFMKKVRRYQAHEAALHSGRAKNALEVAKLRVILRSGAIHEVQLRGRDTLAGDGVSEKFRANAGTVLGEPAVRRISSLMQHIDTVSDINELMDATTV